MIKYEGEAGKISHSDLQYINLFFIQTPVIDKQSTTIRRC